MSENSSAQFIAGREIPATEPCEQPAKFELAISLVSAKALGPEIPASLLARADQVLR